MKKVLFILPLVLILFSCKVEKGIESDKGFKDFIYKSDYGNTLTITIPDIDIYSYENPIIQFKIEYKENFSPELPDWTILDDSMSIVHVDEQNSIDSGKNLIGKTISLTLDSRLPGEYLINPLLVNFYEKGLLTDSIQSDYIPIKIISSLVEGQDDLFDNFEYMAIKRTNTLLIYILLITVISIGLIIFAVLKKIKKNSQKVTAVPETDYIKTIENIHDEDIKKVYNLLSNSLKELLDKKLFLSMQFQTTEEIIKYTKHNPMIEEWLKIQLISFLQRSDQIRFGDLGHDENKVAGDIQFCKDFIDYINKKVKEEIFL